MIGGKLYLVSAIWLGILTSLSPCPLATNIAAVSFLAKRMRHPASVCFSAAAYTLGRMVAYTVLGAIIIGSLVSVPQVAQFLQRTMGILIGPLLILTGLCLLDIITIPLPAFSLSERYHKRMAESGAAGAFLLGIVFALAFCPVSAALFFGSLIPLAVQSSLGMMLPFAYGVGTALPVGIIAVAIALGVTSLERFFRVLSKVEYYSRRVTGGIFVIIGLYYLVIMLIP